MELYKRVKVINDNYLEKGIKAGSVGYVIEVYDEKFCEVEFSYENGITYGLCAVNISDMVSYDEGSTV